MRVDFRYCREYRIFENRKGYEATSKKDKLRTLRYKLLIRNNIKKYDRLERDESTRREFSYVLDYFFKISPNPLLDKWLV